MSERRAAYAFSAGKCGPLGEKAATDTPLRIQRLVLEDFPQPALARALSPNGRAHWGVEKRAKDAVAVVVVAGIRTSGLRPVGGPVRLTCRWVFPTRARRDLDNLSTGVVKRLIDVLREQEILADDDSRHVVELRVEAVYEKGRRALEIVMEEAA